MPQVTLKNVAGTSAGSIDLDDAVFGLEPNVPVMHQVVVAQLAAARAGTQSAKTRSEVSGGGPSHSSRRAPAEPRAGSTRSPNWRGGGVALGPKPRKYDQRTPKKMKKLALHPRCRIEPPMPRSLLLTARFPRRRARSKLEPLLPSRSAGSSPRRVESSRCRSVQELPQYPRGSRTSHRRAQHIRRVGFGLR